MPDRAFKGKPIILVVDDQPQNVELLARHLVPRGYEIVRAASGEEALEKLSRAQVDLILLDAMMPAMSGFDVLQRLRAGDETRLIPVVMVTALHETEDRVRALEAGCDDFISKPFDKIELLARVEPILKMGYYRRQLDEKDILRAVVDKMSDGIAICTPDWIIKDSNAAVLKYLNIADPTNVNLVETLFGNYSVSIPRKEFLDLEIAHKTVDIVRQESEATKALYLEAGLDAIRNLSGELSSIVFTLRDVTAARREELIKQDFLSHISHKLRTPLAVIGGDISLLRDGSWGPLTDEQKEAIDSTSRRFSSLVQLVEKLIGFTIVYSEQMNQPKETVELKSYLPSIMDLMTAWTEDKHVEVDIECPEGAAIRINRTYLDQVMANLVENAIRYNDKAVCRISIAAKTMPGTVEVSITDNGPGIPNEEFEHIFEMFYQVEKHFTGQIEGFGLGLAIAKKLIEREDGNIKVASKLGRETTFTFSLPTA
jgi:signal transduction histidine kinase